MQRTPGIRVRGAMAAALLTVLTLAACGGGGGSSPLPHTTASPAPTATPSLPAPAAQTHTQTVTPSASAGTTVTLPATGGITPSIVLPKLKSGSGSISVTVASGADATLDSARRPLSRRAQAMAGGPYLLQMDFVPDHDLTFSAVPGFTLDVTQYVTGAGLTIAQAAAFLQGQSVYAGIVDDSGNLSVVGPLVVIATNTALTISYSGPNVAVSLSANQHYTIGIHLGPIAAPTAAPTSSPSSNPTSSPTAAPTAAPTNSPTPVPTNSPTPAPTSSPTTAPSVSQFPLTDIYGTAAIASGIAADSTGNVWFTENPGNVNAGRGFVNAVTSGGGITPYDYSDVDNYPAGQAHPSGIAFASGKFWMTNNCSGTDVDVVNTTGAYLTSYGGGTSLCSPGQILTTILGADGNLWFVEGSPQIGSISTGGTETQYPLGNSGETTGITNGPDAHIWFAEQLVAQGSGTYGGLIGTIGSDGKITAYPLNSGEVPYAIAAGSDGNLWFTYTTQNSMEGVGKMTTGGKETDYTPLSAAQSSSDGAIASGPDGAIWFGGHGVLGTLDPATGKSTLIDISTGQCNASSPKQLIAVEQTRSLWYTATTTQNDCIGEVILH